MRCQCVGGGAGSLELVGRLVRPGLVRFGPARPVQGCGPLSARTGSRAAPCCCGAKSSLGQGRGGVAEAEESLRRERTGSEAAVRLELC